MAQQAMKPPVAPRSKPPLLPPRVSPPAGTQEKPALPPRLSPPAASQEFNSPQRPRRPPPPIPSSENITECPTEQPLSPTLPPARGQPAERSDQSLTEDFPPPPKEWLEKPYSRRKERKQLGLEGTLTVGVPVAPDPYFKSDRVMSLNVFNFDEFIKNNQKTIIMFFHSRKKESFFPSREFANASKRSSNLAHTFAAVDCAADNELCCREQATRLPTVKLYSNGFPVGSMSVLENFTADQMNMLMTMAPVLHQPREQFVRKK